MTYFPEPFHNKYKSDAYIYTYAYMYVSVIVIVRMCVRECVCMSYINAYAMDTRRAFMGMACVRAFVRVYMI